MEITPTQFGQEFTQEEGTQKKNQKRRRLTAPKDPGKRGRIPIEKDYRVDGNGDLEDLGKRPL